MKEGSGKIYKQGGSLTIRVPYAVACDASFPFKPKEAVKVRITNHSLLVEKKDSANVQ